MRARSVNIRRASRETCGPRQRTAQTQFSVENDKVRRFAGPPTGTTCKGQLRGSGSSAGREVIQLCNKFGAAVQRKVLMGAIGGVSRNEERPRSTTVETLSHGVTISTCPPWFGASVVSYCLSLLPGFLVMYLSLNVPFTRHRPKDFIKGLIYEGQ